MLIFVLFCFFFSFSQENVPYAAIFQSRNFHGTYSCNIAISMFRFKMDATLAGRSYQAYGESFPVYHFGTKIHTQSLYDNPETFDDADLSDVISDKKKLYQGCGSF